MRAGRFARAAIAALLVVAAASCGSGGGGGTSTGNVPTGVALITAARGGQVRSADGLVTLDVPAGALAQDTTITVRPVQGSQVPSDVAQLEPLGNVYSLGPDGTRFAKPVHITMGFNTDNVGVSDPSKLWLPLPLVRASDGTKSGFDNPLVTLDTRTHSLHAAGDISHFSTVTLVKGVATGRLDPDSVTSTYPGSAWTATVTVANIGNGHFGIDYDLFVYEVSESSTQPVAVLPVTHPSGHGNGVAVGSSRATSPPSQFVCGGTGNGTYTINFTIRFSGGWLDYNSYALTGDAGCTGTTTSTTTTTTTTTSTSSPSPSPTPHYPAAFTATFNPDAYSTLYTEPVTDPSWTYHWTVQMQADAPCGSGFAGNTPQSNQATWFHADKDAQPPAPKGPCDHNFYSNTTGHPGYVTLVVTGPGFHCQAQYFGSVSGTSQPPMCVKD